MSDLYMSWFNMPGVILIYPVYLMNNAHQEMRRSGYRAVLSTYERKMNPSVYIEMNAYEHSLSQVCSYINTAIAKHPELKDFRIMFIDQLDAENARQMDLTNEETTLLSILQIG
jgi:hypothetical protein